jgi:hypothetical protein
MPLDILTGLRQKQARMSPALNTFYAQWRVQSGVVPWLRDDGDVPPERLLQAIWQHQRLLREKLKTADGRRIQVLHPGFHNVEGGPDFRGALIQVGEESPEAGDIEVDLRSSGWHAHGHDRNPDFRKVVLHVIWEGDRILTPDRPTLQLRQVLDAPLGELSLWFAGDSPQGWPEALRGKCCAPLRQLDSAELQDLLHQAAGVRLQSKASQFKARAREAGWEQALWEGLFRALGYKHNIWPMQRLGEMRPNWFEPRIAPLKLQARLLGLSGLLPSELTRTQAATDTYLRRIWDQWWREQAGFADSILPRSVWRLHGLRPANNPQRRLALAAGWSGNDHLTPGLERWCAKEFPKAQLAPSLAQHLAVPPDDFWSWHWTLRSARLRCAQSLLGETRVTDLAINVILPWLWIRAEGNPAVQKRVEDRFFAWPAAQDNSILKHARQRLLGTGSTQTLRGAAAQQGLMQVVRDFCDNSNAVCEWCRLPDLVREFGKVIRATARQGGGDGGSR